MYAHARFLRSPRIMEEVTKCRYIDCVEVREKEQILHELPVCDTSLCVRWLINSGHVDLIGKDLDSLRSMKFFICNNHFTEDCYLSKGTLKENAIPSPHWSDISRTLKTSKAHLKSQSNGGENSMEETRVSESIAKNGPSEFEVDQWCRTCATKKHNLVSMTTKATKGTEMSLLSKLKLLIEIDDEDALPTKMCDECVDKLEKSFKFFQQIYVADNTLRHVFPNARLNSVPRKPLYSLGEHMRKEQKEKEKEKDKDKDKDKETGEQDRATKINRGGVFRRGRGRPRTRGYAGRARSRSKPSQVTVSIPSPTINNKPVAAPIYGCSVSINASVTSNNTSANKEMSAPEENRQSGTVLSLLMDTCRSDEELDWSDVLKVMNCKGHRDSKQDELIKNEGGLAVNTDTKMGTKKMVEQKRMEKTETTDNTETTVARVEARMEIKAEAEVEIRTDGKTTSNVCDTWRIRCEFCNEAFRFRRQLQVHLLADHTQLSGYMCTDCLDCYESESLLSKHRALCHGERRYRCEHCQKELFEKKVLREHVNECHSRGILRYSCDSCGVAFASKQLVIQHVKNHSDSCLATESVQLDLGDSKGAVESVQFDQDAKCPSVVVHAPSTTIVTVESKPGAEEENTTARSSGTSDQILIKTEQRQNDQEYVICPDCNEKMSDMVELSIHRMRSHSAKRKDATCLLCDNKSFYSAEEYEQHMLDHCKRSRVLPRG
ncbi:uncharacterized protein LOC143378362 isoform X2 [Andrena cerasifolii]|uniref:uncharacterized protein LOC143378362 isoform X2 n=1 Tax=Andrena cerasifolii TaxID=2819439 RepID=UPI0040383BA3